MNTRYARRLNLFLLATAIRLAVTPGIAIAEDVQSAAELLEEGIYTEQTIGDLSTAIEIYTRVVEHAEANRPHVAQAQLRLGMCYLKQGSDEDGRRLLEELLQKYPEQEQLVAEARSYLAAAQPALALSPVPWEDGEYLEYRIALPTGRVMGALYLQAESTVVDGVDAWQLRLHKLVLNSAANQGVSRILVDAETLRPIRSAFRHGILGNADAVYGPDGVTIRGGATDLLVDSDQDVYDNEQVMHLMRRLPLAPGYKTRLSVLPTWVGKVIDVDLEVTGQETCEVPAGEFDCYAVSLHVDKTIQKLWFSAGPSQHLLKQQDGGVVIELVKIGRMASGVPAEYSLEEFGLSGTLPKHWLRYEHRVSGRDNKAMVRFLDPEVETVGAIELDRCPTEGCPPLLRTAERELSGARERFEAYELREGSWTERTIDGRPAISFVGDYLLDGKPWVQYRIYTITETLRLETIFRAPKDRFEALRADFDSVVENLRAE